MLIFVIAVCDKKDVFEIEPIMFIFCAIQRWRKIARSFPLLPPPQRFPLYPPPPPPPPAPYIPIIDTLSVLIYTTIIMKFILMETFQL